MDYGQKMERERADLSWAILPSYSNVAFKKSSETIVDSGFYTVHAVHDLGLGQTIIGSIRTTSVATRLHMRIPMTIPRSIMPIAK